MFRVPRFVFGVLRLKSLKSLKSLKGFKGLKGPAWAGCPFHYHLRSFPFLTPFSELRTPNS